MRIVISGESGQVGHILARHFQEQAHEVTVVSRGVVPGLLLRAGFEFRHPEWPEAARELVKRWRENARDA